MQLTLEEARRYKDEVRTLGAYGDTITEDDVKDVESLRDFVIRYLAAPFTPVTVDGDTVVFMMYE